MTKVLSLTTTTWRSFYETQVSVLEAEGIEVTTVAPPNEFRAFGDRVERRSISDYARFHSSVLRESLGTYDLVHANYGLTAPFALAQPIRPVVVTLWGGEFIGNKYEKLIRACVNRADEVIVPSTAMGRRVNRDHHVIPFPVDTELFRPIPREEARNRLGWTTEDPIVLFPSAEARYEKNFARARRVVDRLDVNSELRAVANEPYEDMPYYLNASDAVLVTSRWESGPMVVKEAVACNVPVVSTDVGFVADVLDGIVNTAVGSSEKELVGALQDILRDGCRSDGRDRIAAYDRDVMGNRLVDVYDHALNAGDRSDLRSQRMSKQA